MGELPEIIAHNALRFADLVAFTSEQEAFPARRVQDHRRFPRWKATSAADQILEYRLKNGLQNGTWDNSTIGWIFDAGVNIATFSRQTSVVFLGAASGEIDTTTYTSGKVIIRSRDRFFLEEGKTYSLSFVHRVASAAANPGKLILYRADGVALETISDTPSNVAWEGFEAQYTADADYRGAYIEVEAPAEVNTYYFDEVLFTELRELDTLALDSHNLIGVTVKVDSRTTADGAWTNRASFVVPDILTLFETITATKAPRWRIQFTDLTDAAELAIAFLSEIYTLTQNPDNFDPTKDKATVKQVVSEAGITQRYYRFTKRGWDPSWSLVDDTDFEDWIQFWFDIERGRFPIFWRWRPVKRPEDIIYIGGVEMFDAPYDNGILRSITLSGEEILGQETPSFFR